MLSRATILVLALCAAGALATEYNCDAESGVCQNGGICHDTVNNLNGAVLVDPGSAGNGWQTPQCICGAGFGGSACDFTIRECRNNPCQNGGTCNPADCQIGGGTGSGAASVAYDCFSCTCPGPWTGAPAYTGTSNPGGLCDYPANGCSVNPTLCGNGTCADASVSRYDYTCTCNTNWGWSKGGLGNSYVGVAKNCTYNCLASSGPNNTPATPCLNGGTCTAGTGAGSYCLCPDGYYGNQCELLTTCKSNTIPCQNGGSCQGNNPATPCSCVSPWHGSDCSKPIYCNSNPCMNGGTCHDPYPGMDLSTGYCLCANYTGATCGGPRFCDSNPCQNGAECVNTPQTSYLNSAGGICGNCPKGFTGPLCQFELDGSGDPESGGCAPNSNPASTCVDQASCTNQYYNPVGTTTHNHFNGATFHTPRCVCNAGYADCRCNTTVVTRCPGSAGTTPGVNVDAVCQNGGTCLEWAEGTGCQCRPGFWGTACQNYDNPCLNNPCQNQGRCSLFLTTGNNGGVLYSNEPVLGYMFNPVSPYNVALDDRYWSYQCFCKWPYYGRNCEQVAPATSVGACNNNQCQNGATCTVYPNNNFYDTVNGNTYLYYVGSTIAVQYSNPYYCSCAANFTGVYCQTAIQTCAANPNWCMNGGECVDGKGAPDGASTPGCMCPCGYAGERCQFQATNVNADAVATFTGANNGVGYRLQFCSQINCQNGGTCVHDASGVTFACICTSGWADRYCQTRVWSGASGVTPSVAVAAMALIAAALALRQ